MNQPRKPKGFLASQEGLQKLQAKKREKRYTYEDIRKEANVTVDQVKRLFSPKWGYKIGSEAIELIAAVLDLQPEDIVGFDAWNSPPKDTELETTEIDWRKICTAMLESQQEAARLRRKATEQGFEVNVANLQGRTIEEYLLKQWLTEAMRLVKSDVVVTPEIERQLIECFGKGGVWLLLDGVDEMGENSPVEVLAKINRELTASLRQARVVLTCRLNVWDAKVNNTLTGFDTYKTQEFQPEQIDEFIQQWFERAGNLPKGKILQDKLKATQHQNIRKLVTNPLRLSLLCQTFYLDKQGELPETKAALYQRFTFYFYEWKSDLFHELSNSDDLKSELHQALSKLAFAGINSSVRFRLRRSLARQEMGEKLFKLAGDVGWLNLVDRVAETDEEVYAFFHPNFQEYFAALNVYDWHEFFNHVPHNPTQGIYRIFEPQWKEVILLWLGRRQENLRQQQQDFIHALVNFKDGCGQWNRKNVDKGFYEYQAYFLAAAGIAEFKDCSQADEIVEKIVTWGFGNFKDVIKNEARTALEQTDRRKAIAALVQLLHSQKLSDSTRRHAAESLGKILQNNQHRSLAVTGLKDYLQFDEYYNVIWKCSQNMPYPDFYLAWHPGKAGQVVINHLDLLQQLQAAINNDTQLSQNIHLICIDTSKFIDADNPAAEIYAEMVSQGCQERTVGEPNNMASLKVYFRLLKTDKRVVLVFHPGATNPTGEVTYSNAFLNAISKFEGAICFISDPIPDYNTLKVFTRSQPVDEILEWLRLMF